MREWTGTSLASLGGRPLPAAWPTHLRATLVALPTGVAYGKEAVRGPILTESGGESSRKLVGCTTPASVICHIPCRHRLPPLGPRIHRLPSELPCHCRLDSIPTGRYLPVMSRNARENARHALLGVGTELMRRSGYSATSVDEICTAAGVTKGAFFHHFPSKEALAKECLNQWQEHMATAHRGAAYQSLEDPVAKVLGAIDFMIEMMANPDAEQSCLAGTTLQEVSATNPALRAAAHECLLAGQQYFQSLLDAACEDRQLQLDTASLAEHWMSTVQGSLLLAKGARDPMVIQRNLTHFRSYLAALLNQPR